MQKIIIDGTPPPEKTLCQKARARGLPCTTDQCDHRGGYLMFLHGASEALSFQDVADCKACGAPADVFGCPEAPPNNSELARIVGEFVTRLLLHGFDVKSVRVETVSGHVVDFGTVEIGLREPGG